MLGDKAKAMTYYTKALNLEPNHLGANEYMGELYLELNDLAKAEERLADLVRRRHDAQAASKDERARLHCRSLADYVGRRGKVRPEDLARLHLSEPVDLQRLKTTWLADSQPPPGLAPSSDDPA